MAVEILLPKIGFSMQKGEIVGWFAADGEQVIEGQTLFSVQADSSLSEIVSPATGTLKINASKGRSYDVGTVLGYIE